MATDVNTLFQTHTIEGVKNVESQIRSDIEKKKQELRILVGERYRDLINAADTIQEMEKASNEVFAGIDKVNKLCSAFNPTIDEETVKPKKTREVSDQAFYSLAIQMDLLVDTPEKVWSALDKHEYLKASQLYLLSQHIVDNTLHINTGHSAKYAATRDIYASFPIVHHQWAAISHFKPSILKGARSSLKDSTLPDKALAESLCCITLLDNFSPRQVFIEFLNARKSAIQDVFQPNLYSISVKKQICDITHLIKLTIEQIFTMFFSRDKEDNTGALSPLFYHILQELTNEKSSVFQSLFEGDVDVITLSKYLPPTVSGFVPKFQSIPVPISLSFIRKHAVEWLDSCIKDVHSGVKTLLSFVSNIKGLASIRNAVYELLKVDEDIVENNEDEEGNTVEQIPWSKYCKICVDCQVTIWDEFFQPLFLYRTKAIMEKELATCFNSLNESLTEVLSNLSEPDNKIDDSCWDHDVSSFVWNEFSHGISTFVDNKAGEDTLLMKVKGFTPAIKRLCSILDDGLNSILSDMDFYITCETAGNDSGNLGFKDVKKDVERLFMDDEEKRPTEPFNKLDDALVVKENLYKIFKAQVSSLCSNVNGLLVEISKFLLDESSDKDPLEITSELDKTSFIARLCLSIPDMCHLIQKIVDYDTDTTKAQVQRTPSRQLNRKRKITAKLDFLQKEFLEQSNHGFTLWQKWICKMCHESILKTLKSKDDFFLFSLTNWEDISIEEENELGDTVKSTIRVPPQMSFYLSSLLYRIAEEFHRIGGSLMEKESIVTLAVHIGTSILKAHQEFITNLSRTLFQNQAFQIMYDLKFVVKVFGGNSDSKDPKLVEFQKLGNSLISQLELSVDPFDLDVVVPHMNSFVQKQYQTTALLFGSISNIDKHSIQGHKRNVDFSEHHSIVPIVTHPPRFMILPLTGHLKGNQDYRVPTQDYYDPDASPLFLHQFQTTIAGLFDIKCLN